LTRAEYDRTRKLPERKRATRNGKRSIDAFVRSIRARVACESPQHLKLFDENITAKLGVLHFYFDKYIIARWKPEGVKVYTIAKSGNKSMYIDNSFDDGDTSEREFMMQFFKELL